MYAISISITLLTLAVLAKRLWSVVMKSLPIARDDAKGTTHETILIGLNRLCLKLDSQSPVFRAAKWSTTVSGDAGMSQCVTR